MAKKAVKTKKKTSGKASKAVAQTQVAKKAVKSAPKKKVAVKAPAGLAPEARSESPNRKSAAGPAASGRSRKGAVKRPSASVRESAPARSELAIAEEIPKTRLSDADLEKFRDMLLLKRAEILGTVNQLQDEALHKSRKESAGDLSSMPIHMADIGSDNWEQEFTLGLVASEKKLIREIDEALVRISTRTYGVCLGTHKPIQKARLKAKPWAKYGIEYARELELRKTRGVDRD